MKVEKWVGSELFISRICAIPAFANYVSPTLTRQRSIGNAKMGTSTHDEVYPLSELEACEFENLAYRSPARHVACAEFDSSAIISVIEGTSARPGHGHEPQSDTHLAVESISSMTFAPATALRSAMTTFAPWSNKCFVIPRPIPTGKTMRSEHRKERQS